MKNSLFICLCSILLIISNYISFAQPVKIIFDTDMAHDVDDVGALAMLHYFSDQKECEILAIGLSTPVNAYDGYYAAVCAECINTYYGRPEIPIGGYRGPYNITHAVSKYVEMVANKFPHRLSNGLSTMEAYKLYRKVLASAPDTSVVIVVVGFLNNLELLLDSKPDEYSNLNGFDLVSKKVKFVSCMGGSYVNEAEEFNFNTYPRSTLFFLSNWPTRIVFGGVELGSKVKCGKVLKEKFKPEENPVALAWQCFNGGEQRESWDELSVLYAVRGCSDYLKLSEPGQTHFWMRGGEWLPGIMNSKNIWVPLPKGKHQYLLPKMPFEQLGYELDKFITSMPFNHK